jgi:hypothetical protein
MRKDVTEHSENAYISTFKGVGTITDYTPAEVPSIFWELAALVPSKNFGDAHSAHSVEANKRI